MFKRPIPIFPAAILAIASLSMGICPGSCQDKSQSGPDQIELSKLDTFLKNKDGKLIQYFNITFEEFERVYNALNAAKATDTSRDYVIRSAEVIAKIRDQSVTLEILMNVELRTEDPVEISVGFDNFIFPVVDSNKALVRRNKEFLVQAKGQSGETKSVQLRAQQTVKTLRNRKHLEFQLPDATFTKIQIHESDSDVQFSATQDSIQKQIAPFFSGGSAIEFSGLKENVTVSWAQMRKSNLSGNLQVEGSPRVEAIIHQDRIDYSTRISLKATDPVSEFELGLPKNTSRATIKNGGSISAAGKTQDAWKVYRVELGRQGSLFEDLELTWSVDHESSSPSLIGFEVIDAPLFAGQLTVTGADGLDFVLGNRFNLVLENDGDPLKSYRFQSSIFSASLFTVDEVSAEKNNVSFELQLDARAAKLAMTIPAGSFSEDSNGVAIALNGWKSVPDQEYLSVDSLLRELTVSPPFFLDKTRRLTIQFELNEAMFGNREFRLPKIKNFAVDGLDLTIRCSDEIEARFDGNRNSNLEFNSEFDSEVIASGSPLKLTVSGNQNVVLKLNLRPILPIVDATQLISLKESKGKFLLEVLCDVVSSKPIESCGLNLNGNEANSITVNGKAVSVPSTPDADPVLIELEESRDSLQFRIQFELPELAEDGVQEFSLPEYLLPVNAAIDQSKINAVNIQGQSFQPVKPESNLSILTSAAIVVQPDDRWIQNEAIHSVVKTEYSGRQCDSIQFTKRTSTDDDVFVEKTWCHTSLNSEFRQDRIVIRFVPQRSMIHWQIPEGTKLVSCKLNGEPVGLIYGRDRYEVKIGFDQFTESQNIEFNLRYFHSSYDSKLQLKLPKTDRLLWSKNLYWSLELPDNQYVLNYSNSMSASYVLAWTGFFLRPTPTYNVKQLERWIEADHATELDLRGNDYLFASFGIVDESFVYVISKRNLVLIFGLFFISLGCAFVSLSFMRNALFLIAIAAGILIFGMWYPIWFVQLLQIEVFVAFLFCLGFIVTRISAWFNPAKDETTIETNVPSLALAAPDSGFVSSTQTRYQSNSDSEDVR